METALPMSGDPSIKIRFRHCIVREPLTKRSKVRSDWFVCEA
jgi:hypothetical protein